MGGPMEEDCCGAPPKLKDLLRGGRFVKDHRAGAAADPSRKPSSNRFGQPSSV